MTAGALSLLPVREQPMCSQELGHRHLSRAEQVAEPCHERQLCCKGQQLVKTLHISAIHTPCSSCDVQCHKMPLLCFLPKATVGRETHGRSQLGWGTKLRVGARPARRVFSHPMALRGLGGEAEAPFTCSMFLFRLQPSAEEAVWDEN